MNRAPQRALVAGAPLLSRSYYRVALSLPFSFPALDPSCVLATRRCRTALGPCQVGTPNSRVWLLACLGSVSIIPERRPRAMRFHPEVWRWACRGRCPMAATGLDVFDKTLQTTNIWLDEMMEVIGPDRQVAWHTLGAVLRPLRDRLPLGLAAHLGSQLPLLAWSLLRSMGARKQTR
jgi:Uncharacterized conserved protein (DUF2267)